ncbi:hypothetical protein Aperf_G00000124570 [Anoplocephala perfoliata]
MISKAPLLCIFLHLLFGQISAFSSLEVVESIGGLIRDERVLRDRTRVDAEAEVQSKSNVTSSETATKDFRFNFSCNTKDLTFPQSNDPYFLACNLTGFTKIPVSISFDTDLHELAKLQPPFWVYQGPGNVFRTFNISLLPLRLGSAYLNIWIREAFPGGDPALIHAFDRSNRSSVREYTRWLVSGSMIFENKVDQIELGIHLKILRARGLAETIFRIIVSVMVCALTLVMGFDLDAKLIWGHMKKPISPLIGFLCQYALMPTIAFGIAMLMPIKPEFGFGLLTIGCCPGGGGSNIWTMLLHGDLNLSMTMTFVSSIAALGMMPLMLFIYGRFFLDTKKIVIPYSQIASQLCYIVVPVVIGMLIKWRWSKVAKTLVRVLLRPVAFIFLLIMTGLGLYINLPLYTLLGPYPLLFPAAAGLPWIGFLLSSIVAFICRRSKAEILTISIETGIQNVGIAILVLLYSMPQPEGDTGAVMPLIVSFTTPIPLFVAYIVVVSRRGKCSRCCKKTNKPMADAIDKPDYDEEQSPSSAKDQNSETIVP